MNQRPYGILDAAERRSVIPVRKPRNPTQLSNPRLERMGIRWSRLALQSGNGRGRQGLGPLIPGVSPVDLRKEHRRVDAILISHSDIHKRIE